MENTARFKAEQVRDSLRKRGFLRENVVGYCSRPFDVRWLYWEPETNLQAPQIAWVVEVGHRLRLAQPQRLQRLVAGRELAPASGGAGAQAATADDRINRLRGLLV